jgi:putative ABC transport system permease protein
MMQTLWQEISYGLRMLKKSPGFTLVAVIAIGLGISANTTIFSSVDALLLRPFSFPNQERLVMLWERNLEIGMTRGSVAPGNLTEWQEQNRTCEQLIAIRSRDYDLTGGDQPERFPGTAVSAGFFDALGVKAALGRTFLPQEGEMGRENVAVLKHSLWQRRFGGSENIIGQTLTLNGRSFTIIGVMPKEFNFPYNGGELWAPLVFTPEDKRDRGNHYIQVLGLLKPGATVAQADADIRAIAERLQKQYPDTNGGRSAYVISMLGHYTRGSRQYLPILIGAVAFVLLIACANVANLLLSRASARQKEIAVRLAMGASRWRLIRQLLIESILLALMGGALGLALSVWGIQALIAGIPEGMSRFIPGWEHLGINRLVLAFTLGVSVLTGLIFGLVPAWQAAKTNLNDVLKEGGGKGAAGASRNRWRSALVVAEIALSLVLLIGAGLMVRSFINVMQTDFGIRPENVVSMRVALPRDKYTEGKQRINFYQQLLERIQVLPGVVKAGGVNLLPMGGSSNSSNFQVLGQPLFPKGKEPFVDVRVATPDYFAAIGTPLRKGRLFTAQDHEQAQRVVLVNEAFAARFIPGQEAVGQRMKIGGNDNPPLEIIGIVANVMNDDLDDPAEPSVYFPYAQQPWSALDLVIRVSGNPMQVVPAVRGELSALDPHQPLSGIRTMEQVIDERASPKRLMSWTLGIFALMALLMAAVGTYAVMAYSVMQRTHEIGVRIALGAQPRDIILLVVGRGLSLALIGTGLGLVGAFFLTKAMAQILYGVTASDPVTFIGVALLLVGVALVACYLPARRAMKVDPMVALRYE